MHLEQEKLVAQTLHRVFLLHLKLLRERLQYTIECQHQIQGKQHGITYFLDHVPELHHLLGLLVRLLYTSAHGNLSEDFLGLWRVG